MDYNGYLIQERKSEETVRTYMNEIAQYKSHYENSAFDEETFCRDRILQYIRHLQATSTDKGYLMSPKTINKKISAIKSYSEYLQYVGKTDSVNVSKKDFLKYQNDSMFSPCTISDDDVKNLIKTIEEECDKKLKMIVVVLSHSGIRLHECVSLQVKNVLFKEKSLFIKGKGAKYRYVNTPRFLYNELKTYISENNLDSEDYLFPSRQSKHVCKSTVNKQLKKYTDITPHQFRHYYCSKLVNDQKAEISLLQASYQLGHSSSTTTRRYVNLDKQQMTNKIFTLGE